MVAQWKKNIFSLGVLTLLALACEPGATATPAGNSSAALTLTSLVQTVTAAAATTPVNPTLATATLAAVSASSEPTSPTFPAEGFPTATEFPPTLPEPAISPPTEPPPTIATVAGPNNPAPAPSVPMVRVTTGTNCRSGPGEVYGNVGDVPAGGRFVLVGKNTQRNYWILRLQNGSECWLPAGYAVAEGNVAGLPEYAIPPEPVPVPQFGSITGHVDFISGGQPVSSAIVSIRVFVNPGGFSGKTDQNGDYTIHNIPVGEVTVTFENSATFAIDDIFVVTVRAGPPMEVPLGTATVYWPGPGGPTPCRTILCDQILTVPPAHK